MWFATTYCEILNINDFFQHYSAVTNSATSQIQIHSAWLFCITPYYFFLKMSRNSVFLWNWQPCSNDKNNYCCQGFCIRWSQITWNGCKTNSKCTILTHPAKVVCMMLGPLYTAKKIHYDTTENKNQTIKFLTPNAFTTTVFTFLQAGQSPFSSVLIRCQQNLHI